MLACGALRQGLRMTWCTLAGSRLWLRVCNLSSTSESLLNPNFDWSVPNAPSLVSHTEQVVAMLVNKPLPPTACRQRC